jgi:hypothetical protein
MSRRVSACVVLGIGMMLLQANALAATLTVNSTADNGMGSLRQAISDAASGDTITFSLPANSAITLTSDELFIDKNLTINGPGANLLSVQRSASAGNFRIFEIHSGNVVAISGLTIANGNDIGGGISNSGTLTLTNATISGNSAPYLGGGIYNFQRGTVTITNTTIFGNSANSSGGGTSAGGGIFNDHGAVTITNSTISSNSANLGGGIYGQNSTVTLTSTTISGNSSDREGGGIYNSSGTINAGSTIIAKNTAPNRPDVGFSLTSQGFNLIGGHRQRLFLWRNHRSTRFHTTD